LRVLCLKGCNNEEKQARHNARHTGENLAISYIVLGSQNCLQTSSFMLTSTSADQRTIISRLHEYLMRTGASDRQ
jgi:hypothetical protein